MSLRTRLRIAIITLVALVVTLFVAAKPEAAAAPPPPLFTWVAAAVALRAIYGAYGGWQAAVYFSEEVHQPERNIARATFAGIALVTALYVLVNAAVLHVVPVGILVNSTLAVSDAAAMVLGPGSGTIVTVLAIICVATIATCVWPMLWPLWFAIAAVLAVTRALLTAHFLSDVLIGAGIGLLSARLVLPALFPGFAPFWF